MDKLTLSRITAFAEADILSSMAKKVLAGKDLLILKKPEKTIVLLQVREPVKQSLFYLGEMLAVHCIVEVSGARGASILMGDDFSKAEAAAVLDAAHSGGFPEFELIEPELLCLFEEKQKENAKNTASIKETQVSFHVLEDRKF